MSKSYEFISEIVDSFEFNEEPDGGATVLLRVPPRFAALALVKLNELTVTDEEISEYENEKIG
jgi:hypothetical protein